MVDEIREGKHLPTDYAEHPEYRPEPLEAILKEIDVLELSNGEGDSFLVQESLKSAAEAARDGNYGIGSVVVHNGNVIAHGGNQRRIENVDQDIAHAEIMALRRSWSYRQENRDSAHEMLLGTSIESCPMCTVATVNSHIKTVVVGIPDPGGSYLLQCPTILPRDMRAIWHKHEMNVRLAEVPDEMRQLCWDVFLATRHLLHEKLHQTD